MRNHSEVEPGSIKKERRRIQKDPDIVPLIDKADEVVVSDKLDAELKKYYVTTRDLETGKFTHRGISARFDNPVKNMEKIAQALLDIQSYRGRVIEIQCLLLEHSNTLGSARRVSIELIRERYDSTLKRRGAIALQEIFIESILGKLIEKKEYIDMLLKRIDVILKNLDTAHFSFKEIASIGNTLLLRIEGGSHVKR